MKGPTDDDDDAIGREDRPGEAYDDPRVMTRIDGEEARLLVHIEPIGDPGDGPTEEGRSAEGSPPESPGLAE